MKLEDAVSVIGRETTVKRLVNIEKKRDIQLRLKLVLQRYMNNTV